VSEFVKYYTNKIIEDCIMYTMNLSFEQQSALVDILECSISEIHSQIVHAENHCFKSMLKERKQVLIDLLHSLKQLPSGA